MYLLVPIFPLFFFNDTATTEIYTLSLHDALPILGAISALYLMIHLSRTTWERLIIWFVIGMFVYFGYGVRDRKSTRLNSSHGYISYAVFCLKKKKNAENIVTLLFCSAVAVLTNRG